MDRTIARLWQALLAAALACVPLAASATAQSKPGAQPPKSTTPVGKAQRCMELKKRIADLQAKPKGQKPVSETVKQDIDWYQKNCL
jgi:hypothetical protein